MPTVRFTVWHPGFVGIRLIKTICEHTDIGLARAKGVTDALLDAGTPAVVVPTLDGAHALIAEAAALHVDAVLEDSSG